MHQIIHLSKISIQSFKNFVEGPTKQFAFCYVCAPVEAWFGQPCGKTNSGVLNSTSSHCGRILLQKRFHPPGYTCCSSTILTPQGETKLTATSSASKNKHNNGKQHRTSSLTRQQEPSHGPPQRLQWSLSCPCGGRRL
jgi:hypothetical protein